MQRGESECEMRTKGGTRQTAMTTYPSILEVVWRPYSFITYYHPTWAILLNSEVLLLAYVVAATMRREPAAFGIVGRWGARLLEWHRWWLQGFPKFLSHTSETRLNVWKWNNLRKSLSLPLLSKCTAIAFYCLNKAFQTIIQLVPKWSDILWSFLIRSGKLVTLLMLWVCRLRASCLDYVDNRRYVSDDQQITFVPGPAHAVQGWATMLEFWTECAALADRLPIVTQIY
jgi:hypothetical protein